MYAWSLGCSNILGTWDSEFFWKQYFPLLTERPLIVVINSSNSCTQGWPPQDAWPQRKTLLLCKSKGLPVIKGKSCMQKTLIPWHITIGGSAFEVREGLCKKVLLTAIEKFHHLQNRKACINLHTLKKAWPISTMIVQSGWLEALTSIWKQKKSLKVNWRMDGPVALIIAYFDLKKKIL